MTDQYYKKEDNLPDTPETIVANHDAQLATLDGLVARTAEQTNVAQQILDWMYRDAEQRGDQNGMAAASDAWQITNEFAVRVTQYDAARLASAAMMKKMADYTRRVTEKLDGIETALNEGDENHPALRDFAEGLREEWNEYEGDEMFSDAMEIAYENVFTELHEGLREATGCEDWRTIYDLCDVFTGGTTATPEQVDLLKKLLDTVRQPEQG
jgi:hypothetical protein